MTVDRRSFLAAFPALAALPEVLAAEADKPGGLTKEALSQAEAIAGVSFSEADRDLMLKGVEEDLAGYREMRKVAVANSVPPALSFDPRPPGFETPTGERHAAWSAGTASRPAGDDDLAFSSAADLSRLLAAKQVSSRELTELYLARLERYDPILHCAISLTRKRALAEADRADHERAAGTVRGPLHGIPWGAKDLLAAKGSPTTWGTTPYKEQVFDEDATVVARLTAAGAVLAAKLTLGELAWGDVWFGGKTRNPWKTDQGSSGSSAGSASATAAGLVGFAIGSETWGSIVSPSTRCGTTGLRPTFGRVPKTGAMALSWSMDKLGPICRSVEDCALVFAAIHGADGKDTTAFDGPFSWPQAVSPKTLRLGYLNSLFEEKPDEGEEEAHAFALGTLTHLRELGFELIPFELPADLPVRALSIILSAEAAAAFSDITHSGKDDLMARQEEQAWPNAFRTARLIPAVEYIQANRIRTLLIQRMAAVMSGVDAFVAPSFGGDQLLLTNLTGHPCVVLPNGFRKDGTPTSITFVGNLYGEDKLLRIAKLYQDATDWHRRRPEIRATDKAG